MTRSPARHAFSVIELLVVIAIIGVLAALLMPVIGQLRRAAQKATCLANLKQFGMASLVYAADNNGFAPQIAQYVPPPSDYVHAYGNYVWVTLRDFGLSNEAMLSCPTVRQAAHETPSASKSSYRYNYSVGGCANLVPAGVGMWLQSTRLNTVTAPSELILFAENGGTFNTANNSLISIWFRDRGAGYDHAQTVHDSRPAGGTFTINGTTYPATTGLSHFVTADGGARGVTFLLNAYPNARWPETRVIP
jgi:prepilin-type N-terminal cleavage/methylation domain-containing protein